MKSISRFAAFIAFLSLLMWSCKDGERKVTSDLLNYPQSANGTQDIPLPVMTFDSLEFKFGTIAIGEKVLHSYHFKNTGDAPLLIGDVKPSCGCTSLKDWPTAPILPGEEGNISIEFNSDGQPGAVTKSIVVHTNAVPADYYLKLTGNVVGVEVVKEDEHKIEMERTK
jgi:hypothetical protein